MQNDKHKQHRITFHKTVTIPAIEVLNDESNPYQKGSSIVLWAETSTGVILGADAIGELRKMSEAVGKDAARKAPNRVVRPANG